MTQEVAEGPHTILPDDSEFIEVSSEREKIFVASPRQLMWWRFRRHRMALLSGVVLILLYLVALTWEFLAPYNPLRHDVQSVYAPPQGMQFFDEEGFHFPPFVYGLKGERCRATPISSGALLKAICIFSVSRTMRAQYSC